MKKEIFERKKMINHEENLRKAIELSNQSVENGSSPFGSVIVDKIGKIIGTGSNMVVPNNDPTAHGEIMAIRDACHNLGTFDLSGCTIYTSCEPCPMCLNAIKWANIVDVYYAATREDADNIGFRDKVFYDEDPIEMHHLELKEAEEVMQKWKNKKDKVLY